MEYIGAWTFIAGVIAVGVGVGLYLERKLEGSHQDITYPSALGVHA
jgi:hypothetical protein